MSGFDIGGGKAMRLILVGWGAIAQRIAQDLPQGVDLVAVGLRPQSLADLPPRVTRIDGPEALAALSPDLVIETAGRAAVAPWGLAALSAGADFVPISTSALVDGVLLGQLTDAARAAGRQVVIAPGALGGMDALSAAALLPLALVRHEIVKPPAAWRGTAAETLVDLDALAAPTTFWQGSASDAATRFPQNANVAAITALAGLGLQATQIALIADPTASRNAHRVHAEGDFGSLRIELSNRPMARNPKTSELTALSLLRLLRNRVNPLVI